MSPHAWHVMAKVMGRADRLTRVAVKAAVTHGAIEAHRSCDLSTGCVQAVLAGARRETGAASERECFTRLMSGFRACTRRCSGRARVRSHHAQSDARGLQRCTRMDLSESDTFLQMSPTLVWNTTLGVQLSLLVAAFRAEALRSHS